MKRPSFQFYPGDWQANSNLRRCSHAEKGVWLDILCLLHDQSEYGVLRWTLREIAQAVGASPTTVKALVAKDVLKGCDKSLETPFTYTPRSGRKDGETVILIDTQAGPIWYSSRMVKDDYVRTIRGESTRFGEGNDAALKAAPNPPFSDGSSSSSSSSSSIKEKSTRKPRAASVGISLTEYLEHCKTKATKPIPDDHPIRAYCVDAGITDDMRQIAWLVFKDLHLTSPTPKKYTDWPVVFANSVKGRWYRLWNIDSQGNTVWSANGLQEKLVIENRMNATQEPDHAPA